MNILFLCTYYHRAMVFYDLRNKLIELGNSVRVFSAAVKGDSVKEKYTAIMDELVIHKECFNKVDRLFYHLKQYKFERAIENEYDIKTFDVIHSHTLFNGGYAAMKLSQKNNVPFYVTARGTDIYFFLRVPGFKYIGKKILSQSNGIVVLSKKAYKSIVELFNSQEQDEIKNKIILTYNGLEQFWLDNIGSPKEKKGKHWELLCVGKINNDKNILSVAEAIKDLNKNGLDIHLNVVGQIVEKKVHEQLLHDQNVSLLGYMTKEELITVYRESDFFVMPSIRETFGRVYAEAMTQGLPVLYSENEGFDGIFSQGEVGMAVNPYSIESIAEGIKAIINNYNKMSKAAVENATKFDWSRIANQYIKMYERR